MRAGSPVIVGADHATSGPASVVQGVYGARGNLELIVPDIADGLWVFWLNADLQSDPPASPDVAPGAWSSGLRFAEGTPYREAVILQSTAGPDHLEVLALAADGRLESWWWSPGPGFQKRPGDLASVVERVAAEHEGGALRVTLLSAGPTRHLVSPPEPYPEREWRDADDGPVLDDDRVARRLLAEAGVDSPDPGTARVAPSDRDGGTLELTWRTGVVLHHLGLPAASG